MAMLGGSFFYLQEAIKKTVMLMAGRSIGVVTAGSNGVGRSIQWRNVPAFNGGTATGEEDERTVASQNDSVFTIPKAAFNLVLGIL
ncbi:hypothetical protein Peur_011651 [Populus x canadensis]